MQEHSGRAASSQLPRAHPKRTIDTRMENEGRNLKTSSIQCRALKICSMEVVYLKIHDLNQSRCTQRKLPSMLDIFKAVPCKLEIFSILSFSLLDSMVLFGWAHGSCGKPSAAARPCSTEESGLKPLRCRAMSVLDDFETPILINATCDAGERTLSEHRGGYLRRWER